MTELHDCRWPGCERRVPRDLWGCRVHWFCLPGNLRRQIWTAYRLSPDEVTPQYLETEARVQQWIKEHT